MIRWAGALLAAAGLAAVACETDSRPESEASEMEVLVRPPTVADEPIVPLPHTVPDLDPRKVALGEKLFRDVRISPRGDMACTSCHELLRGGVDGRAKSKMGDQDAPAVNTPTVFNVIFNFKAQWAGSHARLEEQLAVPVTSPRVLNTTFEAIVERLSAIPEYRDEFAAIYSDGITVRSFKDVMVEFERSLITPGSRFDRYLEGDTAALTPDEIAGYDMFRSYGCSSCHQGINIGGNMFQKLGVMRDFFGERRELTEGDNGRYNVTKREEDRHVFRVPSLRNVAVTAPYLHDGSAKTLEEAVQIMGRYQLGRSLDEHEVRLLVGFLRTLTGEYKGRRLE